MVADEPLSRYARVEVEQMIEDRIRKAEDKQDLRHKENSAKLDEIQKAMQQFNGVRLFLLMLFPAAATIVGIISFFRGH